MEGEEGSLAKEKCREFKKDFHDRLIPFLEDDCCQQVSIEVLTLFPRLMSLKKKKGKGKRNKEKGKRKKESKSYAEEEKQNI